jgi:hemoglobin-like flavoprotein
LTSATAREPATREREEGILLASLDRLAGREQQLMECFYALFFGRHPELRGLFGEHSISEQEEMIRETLASVVAHLHDEPWLDGNLEAMGKSHHEYGVEDPMYDWFLECMLDALGQVAGGDWDGSCTSAWRSALERLTGVMREAGRRASAATG